VAGTARVPGCIGSERLGSKSIGTKGYAGMRAEGVSRFWRDYTESTGQFLFNSGLYLILSVASFVCVLVACANVTKRPI
jgi:hypothetical protein